MNSIPDSIPFGLRDVSHMKAAIQDSELLAGRGAIAFRGSRNDDKGGGGIESIISGGGPNSEQSPRQLIPLASILLQQLRGEIQNTYLFVNGCCVTNWLSHFSWISNYSSESVQKSTQISKQTYFDGFIHDEISIQSRNFRKLVENCKFSPPNIKGTHAPLWARASHLLTLHPLPYERCNALTPKRTVRAKGRGGKPEGFLPGVVCCYWFSVIFLWKCNIVDSEWGWNVSVVIVWVIEGWIFIAHTLGIVVKNS